MQLKVSELDQIGVLLVAYGEVLMKDPLQTSRLERFHGKLRQLGKLSKQQDMKTYQNVWDSMIFPSLSDDDSGSLGTSRTHNTSDSPSASSSFSPRLMSGRRTFQPGEDGGFPNFRSGFLNGGFGAN